MWTDSQFSPGSYFNWKICLLICFEDRFYFTLFLVDTQEPFTYFNIFKSNRGLGTVQKLLDSAEELKCFSLIKQYKYILL